MSPGSGYDMVLLPPRDDVEPSPEPIPPQSVRGRCSGHDAGGSRRGRQRSRISDPTSEARARPALPPHIPHQVARSSGPTGARGCARGASSPGPRTSRGSSRPSVPPRSKGKVRPTPVPRKGDKGASTSRPPPPTHEGAVAAPPELPFGLRNAAATYASSVSTSLSAYAELPGHHSRPTLDLISTPPVSPYPEDPTSGDDEWVGADFFGYGDPETFMRFLEANNYCLGYSNSDDGNYDPSRECFNIEVGGTPRSAQGDAGPSRQEDATPPPNPTPGTNPGDRGVASAPAGGHHPDLAQLDELEARLEEERTRLRQLREALVREPSGRGDGGEARRRARDVNRHIVAD